MMQKRITSRMSKQDPSKHERYKTSYKANDYYWGVGIELETYLQFDTPNSMNAWAIHTNHKRERYSVDYFTGLQPEYKDHLKKLSFLMV